MVLFGQNRLYSGKSGSIQAKVVVFGQKLLCSRKVVVFRKKFLFSGKSGCIRGKWFYFGKSV